MAALYSHTTRAAGTILTANIYNTDHQNHINNGVPDQFDDYSSSVAQMQSVADPGEVGTESQAVSLAGEIERLRNMIKEITGEAQWYVSPTGNLATPRLPVDYIRGWIPSLGTADPTHDLQFSTGTLRYGQNTGDLTLTGILIKQFDNTFASGSNAGGLATGLTFTASESYHCFALESTTGKVDVYADTSFGATRTPTGWTARRRLHSFRTVASAAAIDPFRSYEEGQNVRFMLDVPKVIVNATGGINLSVTGVARVAAGRSFQVIVGVHLGVTSPTGLPAVIVSDPAQAIAAAATSAGQWDIRAIQINPPQFQQSMEKVVYTNTVGAVHTDGISLGAAGRTFVIHKGWVDDRKAT